MNGRPVRLVVRDDLQRTRLTVGFRLFLAVPHFLWVALWTVAVVLTGFAQWAVTSVRGRPAEPLRDFHLAYVRYVAHLTAYIGLAANPFPGFLGSPGYPIDVEIDPSGRQGRLGAFLRLVLALPALFMLGIVSGGGSVIGPYWFVAGGVAAVVSFLGWFAAVVRGSMPLGLRNLAAYGVRYTAEAYSYLLLLTPVYPSSDPTLPGSAGAPPEHPVTLVVDDDRRRSRLTTFFRLFLLVPHLVWLMLFGAAALFATLAQWLFALVAGRPAAPLHRFLAAWARYQTHVYAFGSLVANPFPGFTGARGYPIDLEIAPPERQRRVLTLFRPFLAVPALILSAALTGLLQAAAVGGWFAGLVLGRMPSGLRKAGAHALRYNAQLNAYLTLLTDRYPFSGPPVALEPVEAEPADDARG